MKDARKRTSDAISRMSDDKMCAILRELHKRQLLKLKRQPSKKDRANPMAIVEERTAEYGFCLKTHLCILNGGHTN